MADHTPAPWFDDGYRIHAPVAAGEDPRSGRVIVEYKHVDDFNPADGPLLGAAKDLYDALAETRRICIALCTVALDHAVQDYLPGGLRDDVIAWLRSTATDDALAKADGTR